MRRPALLHEERVGVLFFRGRWRRGVWRMDIDHDRLYKELLRTFFREFMGLFFPEAAKQLDFNHVHFLSEELVTDLKGKKNADYRTYGAAIVSSIQILGEDVYLREQALREVPQASAAGSDFQPSAEAEGAGSFRLGAGWHAGDGFLFPEAAVAPPSMERLS